MSKLLKPHEVADLLGVRKSTIYQWSHQGYIPHVKLGGALRFREKSVLDWVAKKETKGRNVRRIQIDLT